MEHIVLRIMRARAARNMYRAEEDTSSDDLPLRAANLIRALCGEEIDGGHARRRRREAAAFSLFAATP